MTKDEFNKIWEMYHKRFREIWNDPKATNDCYQRWWKVFQDQEFRFLKKGAELLLREWPDHKWPVEADIWCYYERARHEEQFRASDDAQLTADEHRKARQILKIESSWKRLSDEEIAKLNHRSADALREELGAMCPDHKQFHRMNKYQIAHISQVLPIALAKEFGPARYMRNKVFADEAGLEFGLLRQEKIPF